MYETLYSSDPMAYSVLKCALVGPSRANTCTTADLSSLSEQDFPGFAPFPYPELTLNSLAQTFTGAPPQQLAPVTGPHLPDPPNKIDQGPAFTIIPAAATASRIDMQNNTPLQPTQSFKVNQIIYLTFSVPHPNNGTVTAKWYMNNRFYRPGPPLQAKKGNDTINGRMEMAYATPAEGTVELYWNGQLAQRLFFVVRLQ